MPGSQQALAKGEATTVTKPPCLRLGEFTRLGERGVVGWFRRFLRGERSRLSDTIFFWAKRD